MLSLLSAPINRTLTVEGVYTVALQTNAAQISSLAKERDNGIVFLCLTHGNRPSNSELET
jgi:hypothetical protein